MTGNTTKKGKKRASEDEAEGPASSSALQSDGVIKKSKRAVTKPCPVCSEEIPVRLLASHAELEIQRLEESGQRIPSPAPPDTPIFVPDPTTPQDSVPGTRRAALRARKSINALNPRGTPITPSHSSANKSAPSHSHSHAFLTDPLSIQIDKTIRLVQRNRRARHTKSKELSKAILTDLDGPSNPPSRSPHNEVCPVCLQHIDTQSGGETMEQHVNRCLEESAASAAFRHEQESLSRGSGTAAGVMEAYDFGGETRIRVTALTGFAGTGFNVRDRTLVDVDDELDIEGSDEELFGEAQFNEADIIPARGGAQPEDDIDIDGIEEGTAEDVTESNSVEPQAEQERQPDPVPIASGSGAGRGRTLRDLVAAGRVNGIAAANLPPTMFRGAAPSVNGIDDVDLDLDSVILAASASGNKDALIYALHRKVATITQYSEPSNPSHSPAPSKPDTSGPPLNAHAHLETPAHTCRICLDAYTDPTVSIACWHVFCNECWLRCLGSTKLCPICKHISGARDLRRVYL